MGIRLRIKEMAESVGIPDAAELSRRTGISYDTAYRLWRGEIGGASRGERSVGVMTLHRIAGALGCKVTDLLEEGDRMSLRAAAA